MSNPVEYFRITEGEPLPDVLEHAPFRAVVVIDGPYSQDWQNEVSTWLVESGCLYMMAWGDGCSTWDDSVDWANIDQYPNQEIPDDKFVMTTWHERDTLEAVFWYSRFCAQDPCDIIEHSLIVHVGNSDRETELLALYAQAETFVDREDHQPQQENGLDWVE